MNRKLLGFVISLVLMFNITYKYWLPNENRKMSDPEFRVMIMNANVPFVRVSAEEEFVFLYMQNPGDSVYHESLWMILPTKSIMQIRALSQQEIIDLQRQRQQSQPPLQ